MASVGMTTVAEEPFRTCSHASGHSPKCKRNAAACALKLELVQCVKAGDTVSLLAADARFQTEAMRRCDAFQRAILDAA
jgi:hypothetical protein